MKMGTVSKAKWMAIGLAIGLLVVIGAAMAAPGRLADIINWRNANPPDKAEIVTEPAITPTGNEMGIIGIQVSQIRFQPVVILKEKQGERYLPIWIGPNEANSIAVVLEGIQTPRPLSHDLLYSILTKLGAEVNFIVINKLQNDTYYARIILTVGGKQIEMDSRPSDAIAVALRAKAPIYAEEEVLDKAGIKGDKESGRRPTF